MSDINLYRLCVLKTSLLLKDGYWKLVHEDDDDDDDNPFSFLPSSIIEDLISTVVQLTPSGSLQVQDLYHLLTSGRVINFKLEDILLKTEQLVSILMSLAVACQNLRSIILQNVYCSDHYASLHNSKTFMKRAALECVLSISPHLEHLESCVEFDLKTIRICEKLKVLKLNFVPKCSIYDFLEEAGEVYWPHNSLKVLDIFEDVRNRVSFWELAVILQHCPELTEVHNDIAQSLEFLHTKEMYNGTLAVQYKLQKCFLGSTFLEPPSATASRIAVHIATLTCPFMKEIDILVNDNNVIYALSDFSALNSLLIQWESVSGGDFQLGVQLLLEKIGPNLKNLHILNFNNVDFAAIASTCPNVENLKVEYQTEFCGYDCPDVCFQNLKTLYIEDIDENTGCRASTLNMLLSNCTNLSTLYIQCCDCLNDTVLEQILNKNSLSHVKEATVLGCSLTDIGIRNLVIHLKMLEYFHFSSSAISFEDAVNIVHEINPLVIVRSDFD